MASSEQTQCHASSQEQGSELKYLEFFRLAVIQATSYALNLYEYLKDGSGPLKPAVDSLERTVETVIRPVIQQLQHTPAQLLIQVDNKVDTTIASLIGRIPESIRSNSHLVFAAAKQAPETARQAFAEVRERGLRFTVTSAYRKYEPVAGQWCHNRWKQVRALVLPGVVDVIAPPVVSGAHRLNRLVLVVKGCNVPFSSCIPRLPVEKIESAFRAVDSSSRSCQAPVESSDCAGERVLVPRVEASEKSEDEEEEEEVEEAGPPHVESSPPHVGSSPPHVESSQAPAQGIRAREEEANEEDWQWVQ